MRRIVLFFYLREVYKNTDFSLPFTVSAEIVLMLFTSPPPLQIFSTEIKRKTGSMRIVIRSSRYGVLEQGVDLSHCIIPSLWHLLVFFSPNLLLLYLPLPSPPLSPLLPLPSPSLSLLTPYLLPLYLPFTFSHSISPYLINLYLSFSPLSSLPYPPLSPLTLSLSISPYLTTPPLILLRPSHLSPTISSLSIQDKENERLKKKLMLGFKNLVGVFIKKQDVKEKRC
jgi:hypothetical protein